MFLNCGKLKPLNLNHTDMGENMNAPLKLFYMWIERRAFLLWGDLDTK